MNIRVLVASLVLVTSTPSRNIFASARPGDTPHISLPGKHSNLAGREQTVESTLPCDNINGTYIAGNSSMWTLLCDTDFYAQDIYPFTLAKSFEACMQYCEDHNAGQNKQECVGFMYAPDRSNLDNDCYLKNGLNSAIYPATIHLIGATLRTSTPTTTLSPLAQTVASIINSIVPSIVTPPSIPTAQVAAPAAATLSFQEIVSSKSGPIPTITNSTYLGTSINEVAAQYVSHAPAKPLQLAADVSEPGININLITGYPLASDTGSWTSSDSSEYKLANMSVTPRLSRDGGRGGNINGTNIFIFCDTSTYGEDKDPVLGYLNGFVSSSVAIDESMNGLDGRALSLTNSLGQWQDDVGRLRGWVPMTTGEEAFNQAISGQGYRYAVWPNSSPLLLNETHAIIYAPLVYLEVDMQDQSSPRYTSLGNTLLLISVDPVYGPHAERLHNQFFAEKEINWGSLGGIRAWSKQGQTSQDGNIYVFGQAQTGILVGKVAAKDFDSGDKYSYWTGTSWSTEMPPENATPNALMLNQPIMNMDVIYAPAHLTFIMIYLTPDADNTFYYRYLVGKDNSTLSILPPYEVGGDENYVENILTNKWSEQRVLFNVPAPERGYAYAGGMHAGYFGKDDITNGGMKILCTWTEHTKVDPDQPDSGYAHKSQIIELSFGSA